MATLYKLYSPQVQTSPCSQALASPCRHMWDSSVFTGLGLTLQTRVGTLYKLYSPQVQTPQCSQALASPCGHVWLHSTSSTHHRYRLFCVHRPWLHPADTCGYTLQTLLTTGTDSPHVHWPWPHPADTFGYTLQALLTTGTDSPVFTGIGLTLRTCVATLYKLYSPQVQTSPCSQALASPCGHVWLHSTSSTHHRYRLLCVHRPWPHPADTCGYTLQTLPTTGTDSPRVHWPWPHPADTFGYTLQALLTTGTDSPVFTGLGLTLRTCVGTLYKLYSPQVQTPRVHRHWPHLADTFGYILQSLPTTGTDTPVFTGIGLTLRTRVGTLYKLYSPQVHTPRVHRHWPHPADTFGYTLQALLTTGTDTPVFTGISLTSRTRVATLYKLYSPQVPTPLCSQALASPRGHVWLHSTSSTHQRYRLPRVHRHWPHPADTCGYTLQALLTTGTDSSAFTGLGLTLRTRVATLYKLYSPRLQTPPCSQALASPCGHVWLHSTSSTHHRYRHPHVHRHWPHPADTCGYTLQALLTTVTDSSVFTGLGLTLRTRVGTLYKLYSPQVQTPPCSLALASHCKHVWLHSTSSSHHRYRHLVFTGIGLTPRTRVATLYKLYSPQVQTPMFTGIGVTLRTLVGTLYKLYSPQVQTPPYSQALAPCGHVWLHSTSSTHHRYRLPRVHRPWPPPADMCGYILQALLTTGTDTPCSQALASPCGHVWLHSTSFTHHRYRHPRVHRHWPHLADTCGYTLQALFTTDTDTLVFTGLGLTLRTRVATLYKLYSPQVQTLPCSQALASPCGHVWLHSTSSTHHRYRHPVFTGLGLTLRTRVVTPYTLYSPQVETFPCSQALASPRGLVCLRSTSSTHHRYRFPRVHRPWSHPADTCGYR